MTPSTPTKIVNTLSLAPSEKVSGLVIICEARIPGLNSSLRDVEVVQIYYAPEAKIILRGSLNQENIKEKSDVYFECLYVL